MCNLGKGMVYLRAGKQENMWLWVWTLKLDCVGSNLSSTPSKLYDFEQFIEDFFFFIYYEMEIKGVPIASGC